MTRVLVIARNGETRAQVIENLRMLQQSSSFEMMLSFSTRQLGQTDWSQLDDVATVLFCCRGTRQYHPVRFGELMAVKQFPGRVQLQVHCSDFVAAQDPLSLPFENADSLPLSVLDLPESGLSRLNELPSDSWMAAIDALSSNEAYSHTVFFRKTEVKIDGSGAYTDIETYNPHLGSGSVSDFVLHLVDEEANEVVKQLPLVAGYARAKLILPASVVQRTYAIRSYPFCQYSLQLTLEVPPVPAPAPSAALVRSGFANTAVPSLDGEDHKPATQVRMSALVRDIWRFVSKANKVPAEIRAELLADHLLVAVPNDPVLVEDLAAVYMELERYGGAYELLKDYRPEQLSPRSAKNLFTAVAHLRCNYPLDDLIAHLPLQSLDDVKEFSTTVRLLDQRRAIGLIWDVIYEHCVLGGDLACQLLASLSDFFVDPHAVSKMAELLNMFHSADEVCSYLAQRMDEIPELAGDTRLLSAFADLVGDAGDSTGFFAIASRLGLYRIRSCDVANLKPILDSARTKLDSDARLALYEYLIDVTPPASCVGLTSLRVDVLKQMAVLYRELGRLSEAANALTRARELCRSSGLAGADIDDGLDELQEVMAGMEIMKEYMNRDIRNRVNRLRPATDGASLVVLGHFGKPNVAVELERDLGIKNMAWHQSSRHVDMDMAAIKESIRMAGDSLLGVVIIYNHIGHSVQETVKPFCRNRGVGLVLGRASRLGLLSAIDKLAKNRMSESAE